MGLRDIGASLPPGFRFYPSDEELVCHYLYKKIANEQVLKGTDLVEIDLHTCEPWQLPEVAKPNSNEWYFFSFRDRKYATGYRANRATTSGYWKATGKDRTIHDPRTHAIAGKRKTLVFYRNRAPNGIKTGWIMHEFRLENPHVPPKLSRAIINDASIDEVNSKCDDEYGFLFDLGFEESCLGDGVPQNLEEMICDDDDDGSLVFL
ncbi:NAC domain containing protein 74 [Actinidia rufa]|uniref:NAC domain containing protein 74 n=1 Tax=Actinidia rufa TaxID=165716 RepID=A0A7J0GRV7_9ERIC|nr:NAC domain containing protein 74 [Actinidia rufa]